MAADCVANDLDERVLVDVVELSLQAGHGIRLAHERARGRRVEPALETRLELAAVEGEEVRALLALDVDHLDELSRAHLVGKRGRRVDAEVEARLGERGRELLLLVAPGRRASHLDEELRRRGRTVDDASGRCCDDDRHGALGAERLRGASGRPLAEETNGRRLGRVEAARAELVCEEASVAIGERFADDGGRSVSLRLDGRSVVAAVGAEDGHLCNLAPPRVDDRHALVRSQREHGRAARADDVRLDERVLRKQPADQRLHSHLLTQTGIR